MSIQKTFRAANKKARASHYPKHVPPGMRWITQHGAHVLVPADKPAIIDYPRADGTVMRASDYKTWAAWQKALGEAVEEDKRQQRLHPVSMAPSDQVYFHHGGKKTPVGRPSGLSMSEQLKKGRNPNKMTKAMYKMLYG